MNGIFNNFLEHTSKEEIIAILNNLQEIYFRTDINGTFQWVSPSVKPILGFEAEELIGKNLADLQTGRNNKNFRTKLKESSGKLFGYKVPLMHKSGSKLWVLSNIQYFYHNNDVVGIEGTATVLPRVSETQKELFLEKERAYVTLGSIAEGVATTDSMGNIEYLNPTAEKLSGWKCEEARGLQLNDVFHFTEYQTKEKFTCSLLNCCPELSEIEIPKYLNLSRKDGSTFVVEHSTSPIINDEGVISGIVLVFRDVSQLKRMEERLAFQASHDSLTGLVNRFEFERRLNDVLRTEKRSEYSLCYIDLDNFKIINDSCGHLAGDDLLVTLSRSMQESLDCCNSVLGRVGGDEFVVLLHAKMEKAMSEIKNLLKVVKNFDFSWNDRKYEVTASIGITEISADDTDIKKIINRSDKACYTAKAAGGNRIVAYSKDLEKKLIDTEWMHEIKYALKNNRFVLYKQKGISLNHIKEDYSEIYLRMLNRTGEEIQPEKFLPAAIRFRLSSEIDRWVLVKVFATRSSHKEIISINLSSQSVYNPAFPDFILNLADRFSIDPSCYCFEISENTASQDILSTILFIEKLKPFGFLFSLDDIGRDNLFMGYLKEIPVDFFKIGRCFIKNIQTDSVDFRLVETIHHIASILGKKTIAEFIENENTLEKVKGMGIHYAKGFHISALKLMI